MLVVSECVAFLLQTQTHHFHTPSPTYLALKVVLGALFDIEPKFRKKSFNKTIADISNHRKENSDKTKRIRGDMKRRAGVASKCENVESDSLLGTLTPTHTHTHAHTHTHTHTEHTYRA